MKRRETEPLNEFENNDFVLGGGFPNVFLLGYRYIIQQKGVPTLQERRYLFLHFTTTAASNRQLIFFIVNQMIRHQNIRAVHLSVKTKDTTKLSKFHDFLNEARKKPSSTDAKAIIQLMAGIVSILSNNAICGTLAIHRPKVDHFGMI